MPTKIKYAYLTEQTWLYRRNYPQDVALVLGTPALKRSLKTGDPRRAAARASVLNLKVEEQIERVRHGVQTTLDLGTSWDGDARSTIAALRSALGTDLIETSFRDRRPVLVPTVGDLSTQYLRKRAKELSPGGYKSIRYSVGLFSSRFGDRPITALTREDGRWLVSALPQLSKVSGKSWRTRRSSLDALLVFSKGRHDLITVRTQKPSGRRSTTSSTGRSTRGTGSRTLSGPSSSIGRSSQRPTRC